MSYCKKCQLLTVVTNEIVLVSSSSSCAYAFIVSVNHTTILLSSIGDCNIYYYDCILYTASIKRRRGSNWCSKDILPLNFSKFNYMCFMRRSKTYFF